MKLIFLFPLIFFLFQTSCAQFLGNIPEEKLKGSYIYCHKIKTLSKKPNKSFKIYLTDDSTREDTFGILYVDAESMVNLDSKTLDFGIAGNGSKLKTTVMKRLTKFQDTLKKYIINLKEFSLGDSIANDNHVDWRAGILAKVCLDLGKVYLFNLKERERERQIYSATIVYKEKSTSTERYKIVNAKYHKSKGTTLCKTYFCKKSGNILLEYQYPYSGNCYK